MTNSEEIGAVASFCSLTVDELALVPCTFTSIFTFYSFTDKITFLHKPPLLLDLLCSRFHILRSRVTLAVTVSPIRS